MSRPPRADYVSTTNACKLCTPLGATIAFKGVRGAVPFLHGSQGCATYMRRYVISHFREPMDIASSSLGEAQAVYGGAESLQQGLANVICKYAPELVGVATTCLTETIGDDTPRILAEFAKHFDGPLPRLVSVATPSYQGSHMDGFNAAVYALAEALAETGGPREEGVVNLLPSFLSPEDLRHLTGLCRDFGLDPILLPDYSETLDGVAQSDYVPLPEGGTPIDRIAAMGLSRATIEFSSTLAPERSAAALLESRHGVPAHRLGAPIGLRAADAFFALLSELSGRPTPEAHAKERGRLVDAYVDGHKYLSGRTAVVYGDEDLAVGIASFLAETGIQPVLCATGGDSGRFAEAIRQVTEGLVHEPVTALDAVDFYEIAQQARDIKPDLIVGGSKGQRIAREAGAPLVRVGFPIHDRFGGQRVLHVGYRGALALYDQIVNALLEAKQDASPVGYGYL